MEKKKFWTIKIKLKSCYPINEDELNNLIMRLLKDSFDEGTIIESF